MRRQRRALPTELIWEVVCAGPYTTCARFAASQLHSAAPNILGLLTRERARELREIRAARIAEQFVAETADLLKHHLQLHYPANTDCGPLLFVGLAHVEVFDDAEAPAAATIPSSSSAADESHQNIAVAHLSIENGLVAVWQNWIAVLRVTPPSSNASCNAYHFESAYNPSVLRVHFGKQHAQLERALQKGTNQSRRVLRVNLVLTADMEMLKESVLRCTGITHDSARTAELSREEEAQQQAAAAEQKHEGDEEKEKEEEHVKGKEEEEETQQLRQRWRHRDVMLEEGEGVQLLQTEMAAAQREQRGAAGGPEAAEDHSRRRFSLPIWLTPVLERARALSDPLVRWLPHALWPHQQQQEAKIEISVSMERHQLGPHKWTSRQVTWVANLESCGVAPSHLRQQLLDAAAREGRELKVVVDQRRRQKRRSVVTAAAEGEKETTRPKLVKIVGDELRLVEQLLRNELSVPRERIVRCRGGSVEEAEEWNEQ